MEIERGWESGEEGKKRDEEIGQRGDDERGKG
jgi:hypothetical protein